MYRIAICDDEKTARDEIKCLVGHLMKILGEACQIECAASPAELLSAWKNGSRWDLILLDILMDGPTGLRLAERLHQNGDEADIVFVTSCAEYALEGYRSYPVSFLVKPVTRDSLMPVLKHCLQHWRKAPLLSINPGKGGLITVPLKEICYIEVFRRDLVIHCKNQILTGTGGLSALMEQLPEAGFYRSHRSFIVHLDWVAGICKYQYILKNKDKVPIAIRHYPEAQRRWLEYLS